MPTTLSDVRDRVRKDLHDTDASAYRWSDGQLDRHIDHALSDLTQAWPQEKRTTIATTAGSRDLSLAALTDVVEVEAVEYPAGQYPPVYARFSLWGATLTLLVETAPTGADARVHYTARHVLDGSGTTLNTQQVDVLALGAGAYAALEQAVSTTDRLTTGPDASAAYAGQARARQTAFIQLLHQYGRRNRVRGRRLYAAG